MNVKIKVKYLGSHPSHSVIGRYKGITREWDFSGHDKTCMMSIEEYNITYGQSKIGKNRLFPTNLYHQVNEKIKNPIKIEEPENKELEKQIIKLKEDNAKRRSILSGFKKAFSKDKI